MDTALSVLFWPFLPILFFPPLAFLPAILFALLWWRMARLGNRIVLIGAALLWAVYGIYESIMHAWAETVVAPIRIDLLAIVPLLYAVTAVGIWRALAGRDIGSE